MLHGYIKSIPIELKRLLRWTVLPVAVIYLSSCRCFSRNRRVRIICIVSAWNEFFFALVLMKSPELVTLQVELARYTGMEVKRAPTSRSGECNCDNSFVVLFGFLRKWFTAGLVSEQ